MFSQQLFLTILEILEIFSLLVYVICQRILGTIKKYFNGSLFEIGFKIKARDTRLSIA